ncbi:autotransporter outer membrane beta-barrel domain-containing protein [Neorhizobium galegae]|uniref:autotransporter family protein n=1 Tax=Neorhizobium galegae TaxID=399 RepID=UPI000622A40F|nr:autotransporter outer membrane beta-barrel domain-containing protein [Neorhizobium galegae]CDZ50563.1 Outer membrane autotransporter barrel domain-containing protein [Neorhizobium galegae bv. orientalis]
MRTGCGFHGTRKQTLLSGVCGTALLLGFCLAMPVAARAVDWHGLTSSDWTDGSNWAGGVAPAPGAAVSVSTAGAPGNTPVVLGVTGPASASVGVITVGQGGTVPGVLTIQNGSTLTSSSTSRLGGAAFTTGIATVTGPGSQWNITGTSFYIGFLGTGTLNIENGGQFSVGTAVLGNIAGSSGTLNISSGGILQAQTLHGGAGASQVNFDNGILRATAANATFINGFSGTELNLLAGGLTIDTAGFAVGTDAASGFSGVGGLTVTGGGGIFNLQANSIYSGETQIDFGSSLALTGAGAVANSSRVVADGTFNVSAATAPAIRSLAGSGTVVLGAQTLTITNGNDTFAGVIGGTGGLTVTGGSQTLSGVNTYTGATTVSGGRLAVNGSITSPVTTSGAGILGGTGTIFGDVTNAGVVAPGNSIGTLTIAGNYTGTGGTLAIETVLGGDTSPTDRLVVTGNTAGTTNVTVVNLGGGGAQTVEGIKIVDVGGASAGTFSLLGNYVFEGDQAVVGGAYAYRLYQGGVSTPADGDWYLRSALLNPAGAAIGMVYAPGVPLYESYAGVLQTLNEFGTLRQRTSGRAIDEGQAENDPAKAIWTRIDGTHAHFNPKTSTTGTEYDVDTWTMQAGIDGMLRENAAGALIGGVSFHFDTASADVSSRFGKGNIDTTGYGFDGTLTWYGNSGFYVDSQAALTWYDSNLRSSTLNATLASGNDGFGYGLSVEAGQKIALTRQWSLTPQAQLAYSSVRFDRFTDAYGAVVSLDDADSLTGRLGISADYDSDWKDATGQISRAKFYGIANLYYDFLDGSNVDVSGVSVASENRSLWGGLSLGGSRSWSDDRYAVYAEAFARTSLKDFGGSNAIGAKVGFSVKW